MSVYTKKELVKHLNAHFEDKDTLYVLWWSKDQFEAQLDKEIKKKDWEYVIDNLDTSNEEHAIDESIQQTLMEQIEDEESED